MRMHATAGGVAIACTLAVACGGTGGSTSFGDAARDSSAPSHDAAKPSHDAAKPSQDAAQPAHDAAKPSQDAAQPAHDAAKPSHDGASSSADAGKDAKAPIDASHSGDSKATDAKADVHDGTTADSGHHDGAVKDAHGDADASGTASDASGADAADAEAGTPTFWNSCDGGSTALTGVVYAPNGTDPIPNVRVYAASAINPYPANYCDKCAAPIDPAYASTMTAVDGTFTLNLNHVPAGPTIDFTIQIGRFRKHTALPVTACQSLAVTPSSATVLPGNSAAGDIPKIVVSSGNVDHLDAVLTTLGITEYDCYEGRKTAGTEHRDLPAGRGHDHRRRAGERDRHRRVQHGLPLVRARTPTRRSLRVTRR